jgi:hypothetical protein
MVETGARRFYLTSEVAHLTPEERLKAAVKELALVVERDLEPGKSPHRLDAEERPTWLRRVPSYARDLFRPPHW